MLVIVCRFHSFEFMQSSVFCKSLAWLDLLFLSFLYPVLSSDEPWCSS